MLELEEEDCDEDRIEELNQELAKLRTEIAVRSLSLLSGF